MPGRRSIKRKLFLSILVPFGLAAWAVTYLIDHMEEFKQALDWTPSSLVGLSVLVLAHFTIIGLFSKVIMKVFGLRLKIKEWFGLAIITTLGNYLLPLRGGAGLRAAYLKKRHAFPLTHFLSTFLAISLFTIITNSLAGIASLAFLNTLPRQILWPLFLFFSSLLFVTIIGAWIPATSPWFERIRLPYLLQLIEAWQNIRSHHRVMKNLFLLTVANNLSLTLMIYLGYRAMGIDLQLAEGFLMGAVFGLAGFVSITPGSLGVQEAVVVFSAQAVGISPAQGLALAVVIRVVILFWTFFLGPIFSYLLLKKPIPIVTEET